MKPPAFRVATTLGGAAGRMSRLAGRGDGSVIGGVIGLRVEPGLLSLLAFYIVSTLGDKTAGIGQIGLALTVLGCGIVLTFALAHSIRSASLLRSALEEQRRSKEALRVSEARFRSFMDNAPFSMLVKDLDGRFVMVNRGIERSWGLRSEEILGRHIGDISKSPAVADVDAMDREVVETGRVVMSGQAQDVLNDPAVVSSYLGALQ